MKHRKLGNTGIEVSEIGFGAWGIGGDSYGPVDDDVSRKALRLAFDLGVTLYDTSDIYGSGHSEELIGETLKDVRGKIVIATKVGTLPHFGFDMPQDFSPQHIRKALEESLRRLQTDYIDLYQLHSPVIEILSQNDDIIPTLESFQKEGKIGAFGISVRSPNDGLTTIGKFGFKVVQVNFNMIDHRPLENGLFDLAKKDKVGLIARTPLCFGFLSGRYLAGARFDSHDHRSNWPPGQIERWSKAPQLFSFLLNGNKGQTYAQLALRFCLSYPAVATTIPGMMTTEEVRENVSASELGPLAKAELLNISEVYKSNTFFVGRGQGE